MDGVKLTTLYEVYSKRAIHEGIDDLPLLDRGTCQRDMEVSAKSWGGVVVRLEAHVITMRPMNRHVVRWRIVYVHKAPDPPTDSPETTFRALRGNIYKHGRRRYKNRR